jgi:5-oxoprolinase (ATP-hydrolysing) subunit A
MSGSSDARPPHPDSIDGRLSLRESASRSNETRPPRPPSIDVNADLGEGFPNDRALLELVTSASICCGAHAGTPLAIRQTLRDAVARRVLIGAHPGYPDRDGFGRRDQNLSTNELIEIISAQIVGLMSLAAQEGATVAYLKPHGALYNQAQREPHIARAVVEAVRTRGWPLLGQPGSVLETIARDQGVVYIAEGFPDRRYGADGSLVPRSDAAAMLREPHEIEEQVVRLTEEGRVATLCIHGDEPGAVANATLVRRVLTRHGIAVLSFGNGSG